MFVLAVLFKKSQPPILAASCCLVPGVACGVARAWQQVEGATLDRPLPAQHFGCGCIGAAPQVGAAA